MAFCVHTAFTLPSSMTSLTELDCASPAINDANFSQIPPRADFLVDRVLTSQRCE